MTQQLNILYRNFVRAKVNKEYICNNSKCKILGENFVGRFYFLLMEDWNRTNNEFDPDFHLIIENCKNPKVLKLKHIHRKDKYIRVEKKILEQDKNIFKTLVKQGLFKDSSTAYKSTNNQVLIHRLNLCLYKKLLGLECHHGDKNKSNNSILNLTPIEHEKHALLDGLPEKEFKKQSILLHNNFVTELFKPQKNTLASRDKNIFQVLILLSNGLSVPEISKKHACKMGETTIQKIKNRYFYVKDFLKYCYTLTNKEFQGLNENFGFQWFNPLKFEQQKSIKFYTDNELFDYMHNFLEMKYKKT